MFVHGISFVVGGKKSGKKHVIMRDTGNVKERAKERKGGEKEGRYASTVLFKVCVCCSSQFLHKVPVNLLNYYFSAGVCYVS